MFSRRSSRRPLRRKGIWLAAVGGCAAVLAVAFYLTGPGAVRAQSSADTTTAHVGGWGRGGMTMVPGRAGTGGAAGNAAEAALESENWSGYVAASAPGTYTSVSSSWTQPTVTCGATDTFSSFWVGLDGDGSDTVEQTGTEADCSGGAATYAGWWEMFPNAPVFYANPVDPGDAMSASVVSNGGGNFTLTLTDATQGWTQTTQQTNANAELASAEVIAEAPSSVTTIEPLSNFGTASFTDAMANDTAIGNDNPDSLTMVSAAGVTEATPSALTDGDDFTVTWDSSGTAAAAAQ